MANDPHRDIIPTKDVKQSHSPFDTNEKLTPEKRFGLHLTKSDLEDQFYKFKEENFELKKATRKHEDDFKRLATKMNRLLREKKSMEIMRSPGHKRDLELEEMVEDLQDKVRQLEKSNNQLREKALVAKQQVIMQNRRPNLYNHISPKVNSGIIKSSPSPFVSSINLRGKNLQNLSKKSVSTLPLPPYAISLLEEARNELSNLKMLVSNQKAEIELYEQENEIIKQKMRMREIEFDDELKTQKCHLTQLQKQHVQENLDLIRLHREVKQKNSKIVNMQAQYNELEEKMHILKLNHDHISKDMEELAIRYKNEQKKNIELLGELQKAEISFSASNELQEKVKSLMKENDFLRETNDKLLKNISAFEKEKSFNQMEEILKGKIANLESLSEIQLKAKTSVEDELEKEKVKLKSKEEAYDVLQKHADESKSRLENLNSKINCIEMQDISFHDLGKAISLLKESHEKKMNISTSNCDKAEDPVPNKSEEILTNFEDKNVKNLTNSENKDINRESNISDLNIMKSPTREASQEFKEVILNEASKELEEMKLKLLEYEEKTKIAHEELDNVKEMLVAEHNVNEITQEEVRSLTEKLHLQEKEFQLKLDECSNLLDIRASRIQKLEKQLNDIAYGTKADLGPTSTVDSSSKSVQLNRGENIFEIHINKIDFTREGIKQFYSSSSNVFLTWNFYEFELQSTPLVSTENPVFDFIAQYTVQVDDYFLYYLHDSAITIELHESLGVDYRTLASCQLKFCDVFEETITQLHGTQSLISIDSSRFEFGSLNYSVQLKIPMKEAFKYFKEKIKALKYIQSNKDMSTTAIQLLKQPFPKDPNVNQLHLKLLRAMNLKSRQKNVQPSAYCVYKFYDLPDQDTTIIPASNNPEFLDHRTFSLYIDPDFEKYLKIENLVIYVFDDNDPIVDSYIGKAVVPLHTLVQNRAIKGIFELELDNEYDAGSLEILIYWEHDYQPSTSDTVAMYSTNQKELIQEELNQVIQSNSDEEITVSPATILKSSPSTPPLPKPRKQSIKQITSTPISRYSELSSSNSNGGFSTSSPNLSPVHQPKIRSSTPTKEALAPQPAQRKSKLSNETLTQSSEKIHTVKNAITKRSDDYFSDDMSDTEKKLSFDDETDEEKKDFEYGYSDESESDSEIYSTKKNRKSVAQVPTITIIISYLSLRKDSAVLRDSSITLLYVEYRFLNYPMEELETPISMPKKGYPEKIEYNFKKVFTLEPDDLEKWSLLKKMFSSESSMIKFVVVSEPLPEEKELDCEDVGHGSVDLQEILTNQKNKIHEDVLIYDARDSSTVIGVLNVSIYALEALSLMKHVSL